MRKGEYLIPFDAEGNMLDANDHYCTEQRPNDPFDAWLQLLHPYGRSAVKFIDKDRGVNYPMYVVDLVDMLSQVPMIGGKVLGRFRGVKRGTGYGLKWIGKHSNGYPAGSVLSGVATAEFGIMGRKSLTALMTPGGEPQ